ncbi:MAG: hypothetical protein B7X10_02595, partial [Burkholderiales bacterium 21-58-4]
TRHLTRVERSLYRDLIDLYYDTEQSLNGDFEKLARRIICDDEDKGALRMVLDEFFVLQEDGYHNTRCDAEIAKYQEKSEQASLAGKASAAKRLNAKPTDVEQTLNGRTTNQNQNQNQNQEREEGDKSPDLCPHQAIVDLYHDTLPAARRIRDWTPARQQALRTRWREKPERQDLDWWKNFFGYVQKSDFLCGRSPAMPGRKPFELSLDWLCKSENFVKVLEGAYES